jgi:glycosyltransferase involved in cell wall biosynthesis
MTEISVIIPTYNRAHLIGETLEAIFAQTLLPDQVIVVDDGSTDDTKSVLAEFGDRVQPISIANSGDLAARNAGLRMASGRLVAFCDSDDRWLPNFLADMSAQWQPEPSLIACYSDFYIWRNGRRFPQSKFAAAPGSFWSDLRKTGPDAGVFDQALVERLLLYQPFFPSCMMVSRVPFMAAGGWNERESAGSDFATVLRVAARPPVGVVTRPLVMIRKHAGNLSGDTEQMNLRDALMLEQLLTARPELKSLETAIRRSIAMRRAAALDSAFSRRDFGAVRKIRGQMTPKILAGKQRAKCLIAALPRPLDALAAALIESAAEMTSAAWRMTVEPRNK